MVVGRLDLIRILRTEIKSTISPTEEQVERAKLWSYSDDALPKKSFLACADIATIPRYSPLSGQETKHCRYVETKGEVVSVCSGALWCHDYEVVGSPN